MERSTPSPLDQIRIESIQTRAIIGIYPDERTRVQPLAVDIVLHMRRQGAAYGGGLEQTIDYSTIEMSTRFVLEQGQFRLLETAAEALARLLLLPPMEGMAPEAVEITLRKPEALPGTSIAGVHIYRACTDVTHAVEHNYFGTVDIIDENRDCGLYRLLIPPGGAIPPHRHAVMGEAEFVLTGGLILQQEEVPVGLGHAWPLTFVHAYRNPTEATGAVLCINRPKFDPDDEVLVDIPYEDLYSAKPYRTDYRVASAA